METTNTTQTKKPMKKIMLVALSAIIVVATAVYFSIDKNIESTDNAQIDGNIVPMRAGVSGFISKINFKDNQTVKAGDTLIVFQSNEFSAKVLQAEAALENAKAGLKSATNKTSVSSDNSMASNVNAEASKETVNAAKANLDKAQISFNRINELLKIKGATQEQYDNAIAGLQIAKTDYKKAIEQQKSSEFISSGSKFQVKAEQNQIELAKTVIKQKEAELIIAKDQYNHAYIIAPCNGVVSKRSVQVGQYITVGQALCSIIDNDNIWITANLKETQLKDLAIGQSVEIKLDAYPDLNLKGKVESLNGATGSKFSLFPADNATGNFIKVTQRFPIKITIDKTQNLKALSLFPGLSAIVKIKTI